MTAQTSLSRRAAAELIGTAGLLVVVIGSGLQAAELSRDTGVALIANSFASAIGLGLIITLFGPLSGAHLNPVVTLTSWWAGRRGGEGLGGGEALVYTAAQVAGAVGGALLAEAMFGRTPGAFATQVRDGGHLLLGEVVATAGLVLVIQGLERIGRPRLVPAAVAAYIAAAIWFTSSGSFANPAGTIGRSFSDSFTGIAPESLPGFVAAQLIGGVLGLALAALLYGSRNGSGNRSGNESDSGSDSGSDSRSDSGSDSGSGTGRTAKSAPVEATVPAALSENGPVDGASPAKAAYETIG
ncbi:aquaporin [Streptomyces sp. NBC_01294]|uniref:aquaporin n=1 Tax=Streptomyces sp. NBC_01294 TaxID=2903815 RepID=UPI003FA394FB